LTTSKKLCSLQFASSNDYEANLSHLIQLIDAAPKNAIIVAPEVCLTGFDYEHFEDAAAFTPRALESLALHVKDKTLITTMIEKQQGAFFNQVKVLHRGVLLHERAKSKLFALGNEDDYFTAGSDNEPITCNIDGIKIAILICFELRFKTLWQRCEGSDIIVVPSRWGKLRAQNFISLSNALAIMNQCYVIASDASNDDCSAQSGIITPSGDEKRNQEHELLEIEYNPKTIVKMRRYLNVGIPHE
jgi:omega-amidase